MSNERRAEHFLMQQMYKKLGILLAICISLTACGTSVTNVDVVADIADVGFDATLDARRDVTDIDLFDVVDPRDQLDVSVSNEASSDIYEANDGYFGDLPTDEAGGDSGSCRADSSALFCGINNCTECRAPAHAEPHCNANTCAMDLRCEPGFADCDLQRDNGCEANLANDPLNCGACATVCAAPAHGRGLCTVGARCDFECTGGYVRRGASCVVPAVGLRRPLSATLVVGSQPQFRWAPVEPAEEYRIEICTSRDCAAPTVLETAIVRGANVYQMRAQRLNTRIHFWRVHALIAGRIESTSATWEVRSANPLTREATRQRYKTLLDLNGDGREEIIAADYLVENGVEQRPCRVFGWLPNDNAGATLATFRTAPPVVANCAPRRLGDINGDGYSDWIAYNLDPEGYAVNGNVLLGGPDLQAMVRTPIVVPVPRGGSGYEWVGDINDDGYQDVIASMPDPIDVSLRLYLGSPIGLVFPGVRILGWDAPRIYGGAVEDYDGDGRPEIIVSGGGYSWDRQTLTPFGPISGNARLEYLGDVNGDGVDDVGFLGTSMSLLAPNGTVRTSLQLHGRLADRGGFFKGTYPIGDVNRDGIEDAVALGWVNPDWLIDVFLGSRDEVELATSDYSLHVRPITPPANGVLRFTEGISYLDFRGDGDPYLVIGRFTGFLSVYRFGPNAPVADPENAEVVFRIENPLPVIIGRYLVLGPSTGVPVLSGEAPFTLRTPISSQSLRLHSLFRAILSTQPSPTSAVTREFS